MEDLVRRMIAAKIHGAEGIFCSDPFDAECGLMEQDGTPGELLLPWRTTALMLGGAKYLGAVDLPGGSPNAVFARPGDAVMVIWNPRPQDEPVYLGANIRQVDLWGRVTQPAERGRRPAGPRRSPADVRHGDKRAAVPMAIGLRR